MDARLRQRVWDRAANRCEYCLIPQDADPFYRFHVEHIIARQHGGADEDSNLALACHHCNLHKGPNLTGIDPQTLQIVPILHPRRDNWNEHLLLQDGRVEGITPVGRATARLLQMNALGRVYLRRQVGT